MDDLVSGCEDYNEVVDTEEEKEESGCKEKECEAAGEEAMEGEIKTQNLPPRMECGAAGEAKGKTPKSDPEAA